MVAGDRGNLVALHLLGVLEAQQNNATEAADALQSYEMAVAAAAAESKSKIECDLRAGKRLITPLALMAVLDSPRRLKSCA